MVHGSGFASCILLASRHQYASGHVWVPDLEQPVAAIWVGDRFYSFFKTIRAEETFKLIEKLSQRGDRVALTETAQGYALWIWEVSAAPTQATHNRQVRNRHPAPAPCLLVTRRVDPIEIWVPDLDQPLDAIYLGDKYYSIFRVEPEIAKALELTAKITQRGDEAAIARLEKDYAVCIWEPEIKATHSMV